LVAASKGVILLVLMVVEVVAAQDLLLVLVDLVQTVVLQEI
jgi:hypothetical protein